MLALDLAMNALLCGDPVPVYQGLTLGLARQGVELVGDGYARVPVEMSRAAQGRSSNTRAAVFPLPLADWGPCDSFLLYSGDVLLFVGRLPKSRTITESTEVSFGVGGLVVEWRTTDSDTAPAAVS